MAEFKQFEVEEIQNAFKENNNLKRLKFRK